MRGSARLSSGKASRPRVPRGLAGAIQPRAPWPGVVLLPEASALKAGGAPFLHYSLTYLAVHS